MKCQPCGQDNAASALFCTACRRPLVAPAKPPTRLEPAQPAMAMAAAGTAYGGGAEAPASRNRFAPPNAGRTSRLRDDSNVLTDEEALAAFVGPSNSHYYLDRFDRLANGESGGWNWSGFFLRWYWLLYRKMWLAALLWYVVPSFVMVAVLVLCFMISKSLVPVGLIACFVGYVALPGMRGNAWYYKHCQSKIRGVRARGGSREQMLARLEAAGGTSNVIVIVLALFGIAFILGILSAIALPAYQSYTVKAKVASVIPLGNEVAAAVGRQYEQTGQLPSQADVDAIVLRSPYRSNFVTGVDLDSTSATLTLRFPLSAQHGGSIQFVAGSDNNHHLSWTCTSPADMQRYVPASCRAEGAAAR